MGPGAGIEPIPFRRSPRPTLGVEWEIALIDPETRDLAPKAVEVIDLVQARYPEVHLEKEFLQNTVELVTGVHDTVPAAVASPPRWAAASMPTSSLPPPELRRPPTWACACGPPARTRSRTGGRIR